MESHTVVNLSPDDLSELITTAVKACLREMPTEPEGGTRHSGKQRRKMLTPRDIEIEFGITRRMLMSWRQMGIGPTFTNFGKRVFYERTAFEKFIAAGEVQTTGFIDR